MQIVRKYKKLGWFDLLDRVEYDLKSNPSKLVYLELMDELRMRKLESVSEGGSYKIKAPCQNLFERFEKRLSEDNSFALDEDLIEMKSIVSFIL